MATLPNVPKYSDSFKASDKLGKRKTHSKDDVCAVQTPGSPKPWLVFSCFVSVFSSFFIFLHSSWEGALLPQGLLDCPSTCRTKPCVVTADLTHPAATGVRA